MRVTVSVVTAVILLSAAPGRSRAADAVSDLLVWVPSQANAALFIDADAVQRSQIATKNKWGKGDGPTFGIDSLPPNVARMVVASQIDPAGGTAWEVMVVSQRKAVTEADFARRNGGTRDTIGGRPVVLTPRYGIVAELAPNLAGAYQPPNRQEAGRWLKSATGRPSPDLSAYLKHAAVTTGPKAAVVLAIDTTDMFDPAAVKAKLAKAASIKGAGVKPDALASLIGGMRGVTLTVRLTDKISGEMQLDFGEPADQFKAAAKPLLLEVLKRMGVHGEEMDEWTATVRGNTVTFGGELTQSTTDLLLSPFLRPSASSLSDDSASSGADAKAQASLNYFRAVDKKIREVRASKNPTFTHLVSRFNSAARQIDDLRILDVDEELLEWGNALTTTFRTMAITAQVADGQISLLDANKAMSTVTTPNYYYGSSYGVAGGYWGGAGYGYNYAVPSGTTSSAVVSNYGQIANLQSMTNQQEHQYRLNTWKTIETKTTDVRRKMVKKYGIEF